MNKITASETVFSGLLQQPANAMLYETGRRLKERFEGKYIVEIEQNCAALAKGYAVGNGFKWYDNADVHAEICSWYDSDDNALVYHPEVGEFVVEWRGHDIRIFVLRHATSCGWDHSSWIVGENKEITEKFCCEMLSWDHDIRQEVLVFEDGYWSKDEDLYRAIGGATLDNLVLPPSFKTEIVSDLERFFASKDRYAQYGVPWKRGLLLVGPPGNGKTHAIKALVNHLQKPCLYVKSFRTAAGEEAPRNIRAVFARARSSAPCVLVLEDLDSLIGEDNLSFFLNELDGFAENNGIILVASTNHPERLDVAIVDRPSRFDRKYHFNLPNYEERMAFLSFWDNSFDEAMKVNSDVRERLAQATEGFSYAYLKELIMSSLMKWVDTHGRGPTMGEVMIETCALLQSQRVSNDQLALAAEE